MKSTEFLQMNVPELTDKANVTKLSDNMETIDGAVKTLNTSKTSLTQRVTALETHDGVVDGQITTINSNVSALSGIVTNNNTAVNAKITALETKHDSEITSLTSSVNTKVEKSYVDTELAKKANSTALNSKVDKIDGKGLSSNDYTTSDKEKLYNTAGIANALNGFFTIGTN